MLATRSLQWKKLLLKKQFVCGAVVTAAIVAAFPALAQEEKILNIYNWSDYIAADRRHGGELREGNRHQGALRRL